ncbi:MAG: RNA polymerase sporulation sigma factor SigK [Clostridia bacterium]|nr:RNA polymerase sporulation sigma factor SigK [Clostridia bacterium]
MFKEWIINLFKLIFKRDENLLFYLCNDKALPQALTEVEEQELIKMLDSNPEYAKQKLIEHNLRLVVYIAKKFENVETDLEDLISIGSIGLIKAINSFKSDKNIKIATYASKCIENEILMHLRKISKIKQEVSLNEPLKTDSDGNELMLCDVVPSDDATPESSLNSSVEVKLLWQIINSLNSREREIMILRFGLNGQDEQTQKDVATSLNISQSYISRLEKKIVKQIKKEMLKIS